MKKIIINGIVRSIKETIDMYTFAENGIQCIDMDTICYRMNENDGIAFDVAISECDKRIVSDEEFFEIYLKNAIEDLIILDSDLI